MSQSDVNVMGILRMDQSHRNRSPTSIVNAGSQIPSGYCATIFDKGLDLTSVRRLFTRVRAKTMEMV